MPRQPAIPLEIQAEVQQIVEDFNHKNFKKVVTNRGEILDDHPNYGYTARFKGKFLYLDRIERRKPSPICRLTWTGAIDKWDFAIYKYSDNRYDSDEWFFPGSGKVDGTITGAMEAGMEAYPI
jgi:hypothetical protein